MGTECSGSDQFAAESEMNFSVDIEPNPINEYSVSF